MHLGGQLIKQFDAFLHLFRAAAEYLHAPLMIPHDDQFAMNRILAGLGGPPAAAQVRLDLDSQDSLPALCLFLIMQKEHCPVGLLDERPMARVRQMVHIVAHGMVPMAAGGPALTVEQAAEVMTDQEVWLHPLVTYNEDGEVASVLPAGGQNRLRVGAEGAPYKVAINPGGPVDLDRAGPLHPVIVHATWRNHPLPFLQL